MKTLNESQARTIDACCKILTAVALVVGGFFALVQYFGARRSETQARELELKKPFLEKRLEFCIRATTDAATIATDKDGERVADAKRDFLNLSWGPLVIVGDQEINVSMGAFRDCLDAQQCPKPLNELSLDLAEDCAESLQTEWGVPGRPRLLTVTAQ